MSRQLKAGLDIANAILDLGSPYTILGAYYQVDENCADACHAVRTHYYYQGYVPRILNVIYPDKIVFYDNGQGMNPYMHPSHRAQLDQYLAGDLVTEVDIRETIPRASRSTLEWMVVSMALSSKIESDGGFKRGEKGIGSLAYLSIANQATIITRPIAGLKSEGYYPQKGSANTFILQRPTKQMLRDKQIDSSIEPYYDEFVDPFGNEMPHGTITIIEGLEPGVIDRLRLKAISEMLASKFGKDSSFFEIGTFVENNKRGGNWQRVLQKENRGRKVFIERLTIPNDMAEFDVALYYDENATSASPMVTRKDGDKFPLTSLDEFNIAPWNQLKGTVVFPEYVDSERLWDTRKEFLLPSKQRSWWMATLKGVESQVAEKLAATQQALLDYEQSQFARDLSQATRTALSELPFFEGQRFRRQAIGAPRQLKPAKQKSLDTRILVKVINEHGEGFSGAVIELVLPEGQRSTKQTGPQGRINFGSNFPRGKYRFQLRLRDGVSPMGESSVPFRITADEPGFNYIFQVNAGDPKRPRRQSRDFNAYFHVFDDPDLPWRQDIAEHGIIEYNIGHDALHNAILNEDELMQVALVAEYTAASITAYYNEGGAELTPEQQSELFGKILFHMFSLRKIKTRAKK